MFCPKCGAQNPDGAVFCGGCGSDLQASAAPAPAAATYAPAAYGAAPAVAQSGPLSTVQALLSKKPVIIGIAAVVVIALIAIIVSLVLGPGKVSYTMSAGGQSVGPVEFAKQGDDLVVTMTEGNMSSSVTLTKEGTMDGGTIYSLPAGQGSLSSLGMSSSYSYKFLIPDGFFRGDLKGKWIMYSQYGSSSGTAYALDLQNGGTGTQYYISSMDAFPTSFTQMQSAKITENFTWTEKGGKWTLSMDGSNLIVEKVG